VAKFRIHMMVVSPNEMPESVEAEIRHAINLTNLDAKETRIFVENINVYSAD